MPLNSLTKSKKNSNKKAVKLLLKKLCARIVDLADQYKHEQQRKAFSIPSSASFYKTTLLGNISIGEFTYINEYSTIDSGNKSSVKIGRHCAIGRYVHITSKTHDLTRPTTHESTMEILHKEADVKIGNYVWIGDHVIILPGVVVGDHAVIGANSVVNKNVQSFEIVGGVPAHRIGFNEKNSHYAISSKIDTGENT